jgi:hypothetical protein
MFEANHSCFFSPVDGYERSYTSSVPIWLHCLDLSRLNGEQIFSSALKRRDAYAEVEGISILDLDIRKRRNKFIPCRMDSMRISRVKSLHYLQPLFTGCGIRNGSLAPLVSNFTILHESELVPSICFLIA